MSKSLKEIEAKLIKRLASVLGCKTQRIDSSTPLHLLGVDSLSFVELLVFVENEFKIKLMETKLSTEDFKTIHSLASCIAKL